MSSFAVKTYTLAVSEHPNADRLDMVSPVGTLYQAISVKGRFVEGDRAVYVPEAAVLPENVLKASGFWDEEAGKGMLAGTHGNRVKAIRLRSVLSQGIYIDVPTALQLSGLEAEPEDWAEALGIVKYSPPIPVDMAGKVKHVPGLYSFTDLENVKNFPDVMQTGEPVVATEKLHGTCSIFSLINDGGWNLAVSSKGQAKKALGIEEAEGNAYWRMARAYNVEEILVGLADKLGATREITLFGETLGVQDLRYGLAPGQLEFRAFDLRVDGDYVDVLTMRQLLEGVIEMVPVLYQGPYDVDELWKVADGKTQAMVGTEGKTHIREGVVVRPLTERSALTVGRVVLKFVSEKYLTRKDATEYE